MMIFKKAIPRRAFLRGVGGLAALPLLDAMVPAFASAAGQPVVRTSFVYFPNGMIPNAWKPKGEGSSFEWSRILEPLAPFRDQALVLSGLDSREALGIPGEAGGEHPRASGAFLTCVHPVVRSVTGRFEPHVGVSVDQIIAEEFGRHTQLASLELGIESGNEVGSCDGDSCLYNSTVSWRDATTPNPIENHPRAVFERLFGDTESTSQKERLARIREKRSILDFVTQDVDRLATGLGPSDREKLSQYLDSVRDVERRIQKAEEQSARELPTLDKPIGVPSLFTEHAHLLFDLLVLAYQTDLTRVSSFMIGREMSTMALPEIGIPDPYHPLTHHQGDPTKIEKCTQVNVYHTQMFAYFLEKLRSIPDGDGSLLDHSIVVFGGGLGDGNMHLPTDLPVVVAGGAGGKIKGGRHIQYPEKTPLANLYLRMMEMVGLHVEKFGDSNGKINLLSV